MTWMMRLSWVLASVTVKARDMAIVIQQGVHFDAAFGLAKQSPREK